MSKRDSSKEVKPVQRVTPVQIKMGQVFYRSNESERNVDEYSVEEFDALALSFAEEITGVKREVWDVFARCKFLNWLLSEGDVRMTAEGERYLLVEVPAEEKSSAPEPETEDFSSGEMMDRTA